MIVDRRTLCRATLLVLKYLTFLHKLGSSMIDDLLKKLIYGMISALSKFKKMFLVLDVGNL